MPPSPSRLRTRYLSATTCPGSNVVPEDACIEIETITVETVDDLWGSAHNVVDRRASTHAEEPRLADVGDRVSQGVVFGLQGVADRRISASLALHLTLQQEELVPRLARRGL